MNGRACKARGRLHYNPLVTAAVQIAGGGVAGLSCALLLARGGRPVEVYERQGAVGGRFAGGWQVLENGSSPEDALAELVAAGFPAGIPAHPAHRATFLDGRGGVFEVTSAAPFAYFVRRGAGAGTLDGWLAERLEETGGRLLRHRPAPASVQVVATGPRQADGVAREVVFTSSLPDTVAVLFDPAVTPTGYAYLFCLGGWGTFGVAQVRRTATLREAAEVAWERFRKVFGAFPFEVVHVGGQYMNFSIPAHLRDAAGQWHVGEAAGVQDFLFGLGNRLAMRSAALVAGGVAGHFDERRFRRRILAPMAASVGLRFLYERQGQRAFSALCRYAAGRDFRELLVRLQRPRRAVLGMAAVVRWAWQERRGCRHGSLCRWCRRRER